MTKPPVLLINLDGSDARLQRSAEQLAAIGVPFERVPAFDGRKLDPATFPDCDYDRALRFMGRPIRGGEIGCYLSHVAAARRFLETGAPIGLVLEDDFRLDPANWALAERLFDWVEARADQWDVANLGHNRHKIFTPLATLEAGGRTCLVTHAHYFPMTTSALLWTRGGAGAFLAGHGRIFAPVDNYLRHWQTRADRGLATWPPLVTTTDAVSEIDHAAKRSSQGRAFGYGLVKQRRLMTEKAIALVHKLRARLRRA